MTTYEWIGTGLTILGFSITTYLTIKEELELREYMRKNFWEQ